MSVVIFYDDITPPSQPRTHTNLTAGSFEGWSDDEPSFLHPRSIKIINSELGIQCGSRCLFLQESPDSLGGAIIITSSCLLESVLPLHPSNPHSSQRSAVCLITYAVKCLFRIWMSSFKLPITAQPSINQPTACKKTLKNIATSRSPKWCL